MLAVSVYGDIGVGKTSLVRAMCGLPPTEYEGTLGYDVKSQRLNGEDIVWCDASGAERWRLFMPWLHQTKLVLVVYSVSSLASWLNVPSWIQDARRWHTDADVVVVGQIWPDQWRTVSHRRASMACMLSQVPYIEIADDYSSLSEIVYHYATLERPPLASITAFQKFATTPSPARKRCRTFFC